MPGARTKIETRLGIVTQEFHISITPVGQAEYLVWTEKVATGVPLAEALVILPLADWWIQIEQLINEVQVVLQSDEVESGSNPLAPLQSRIESLGQQLYNALFQDTLKDSWIIAQEIAQKEQEVLRLHLELNEVLARLPWKILHTGDYFLAIPSIASRYQIEQIPTLHQSLVILMAIASPAAGIAMPNAQASLALKQAAEKLQIHQLFPVDHLDELVLVTTTSVAYTEETSFEQVTSDSIEPTELDWMDKQEWDQKEDDPTYEEDSALVSDLFRQVTQQVTSPIVTASIELPELASSDPKSLSAKIPQTFTEKSVEHLQADASTTTDTTQTETRPNDKSVQKLILQAVGVIGITFGGFWWFQQPQQSPPPISRSQPDVNLKLASWELQALAIEYFNKGDLSAGCVAVTELLNRGALQSANTALNAVSDVQAKTGAINFLRGRLAWQSIKTKDKNYSLNDVRRYWETAVKDKPNSPEYHNALGFVYYIQGDLNSANQTWFQALYLVEEQANTASFDVAKNELNAYAGLALVLSKLAKNQPRDKQAKLLSEAIKLRQKVLTQEPINSQPQALSKSWLWTEKTIQDWRSLLKLKSS